MEVNKGQAIVTLDKTMIQHRDSGYDFRIRRSRISHPSFSHMRCRIIIRKRASFTMRHMRHMRQLSQSHPYPEFVVISFQIVRKDTRRNEKIREGTTRNDFLYIIRKGTTFLQYFQIISDTMRLDATQKFEIFNYPKRSDIYKVNNC